MNVAEKEITIAQNVPKVFNAGYEKGKAEGGELILYKTETYEYTHSEDWSTSSIGLASNFVNLYCNDANDNQCVLYECEITGNPEQYRYAVNLTCVRWNEYKAIGGKSIRYGQLNNNLDTLLDISAARAFYIAVGAVVTVKKTILWEGN